MQQRAVWEVCPLLLPSSASKSCYNGYITSGVSEGEGEQEGGGGGTRGRGVGKRVGKEGEGAQLVSLGQTPFRTKGRGLRRGHRVTCHPGI